MPPDEEERKDMKNVLLSHSTFHTRRLAERRVGGRCVACCYGNVARVMS